MRVTLILLFVLSFQLVANNTNAQDAIVKLKSNKVSVRQLINEIENQTDYLVVYSNREVNTSRQVNLKNKSDKVSEYLDQTFNGTDIGYDFENNYIILAKRESANTASEILSARTQQTGKTVTGKVVDVNGEPIIGATIVVQGDATKGTVTDVDGNYMLTNISENAVLDITYVGMQSQSISISGRTSVNVTLLEDTELLEEVVVVGYGTQRKVNLTGATASIYKDTFKPRAVNSVTQYLQGAAANLNIINNDGGPGQDASINIRGYSGLGTSYAPLIIVDGFTSSLKELNPNDIQSITVLKDAASAAIYGAQAAYGVILITTKLGRKNTKPTVTYSNNVSYSSPIAIPKTAGSIEFADLMREASLNEGGTGIFSEETLERIEQYYHKPRSIPNTVPQAGNPNRWANWGDGQPNANEDWFKEMFKSQVNQMHNVEVTGGSDNASYQTSIGYMRDEGKLRFYDDNYSKYNANLKLSLDINKWLTLGMSLRYVKEKTVIPSYYFSSTVNSLFGWAAMMWPTQPIRDPNGHFTPDGRIAFVHDANPNTAIGDKFSGNITGEIRLSPDWTIDGGIAYNKYAFKQTSSKGLIYAYGVDNIPYLDGGSEPKNTQVWQGTQNNDYISSNIYSTYEKQIESHNFKMMAGTQMELSQSYMLNGNKTHLIFPTNPAISTAIGNSHVSDGLDHWSTLSYFSRVNYNYLNKYLFEFNIRHDGSSRYANKSVSGSSGKWGTFPSFSAGWNIAKESFFAPLNNEISELKLRGSYGELGNMRGKSYQYISTIGYQSKYSYIMDGTQIGAFGWPSMLSYNTWEKNRTLDFGLDLTILKNRLNASFDYYRKDIIGLITQGEILPAILGAPAPDQNSANIRNKGFELSVSWRDQFMVANKPFQYNITVHLSDYQGYVAKYSNPNNIFGSWDWGVPRIWSNFYNNAKMGEIWGFETDHMVMTQEEADLLNESGSQSQIGGNWSIGDIMYKDLNDDKNITIGSMTLDDPGDLKVIGNNTPRYNYSFLLNTSWNNFDFSVLFQGVGKRDLWMNGVLTQGVGFYSTGSNVWKNTLNSYRNDGRNPDPFWPKFYLSDHGWKNLRPQTKYLLNGAYGRLKNIRIGYTIPKSVFDKIDIENLYIYLSGDNVLTFTKFNENMDPESPRDMIPWQSGDLSYPLSKSYSMGISLTF